MHRITTMPRALIVALASLALLVSCDGGSSDWIVGTWETKLPMMDMTYKFKADGTVVATSLKTIGRDREPSVKTGTYSVGGGTVRFNMVDGRPLTLRISDRQSGSFKASPSGSPIPIVMEFKRVN